MAKGGGTLGMFVSLAVWLTGILVSLAVGFGMIDKILPIKFIPESVTVIAGWIVVVLTLVSVILAIIHKLR